MHRQIKDWSTWRLQKLIWLTANSFSRLNITRLDCHNNIPFSKLICAIERYSKKWAKSNFFNIKTPTTGSLQIWLRDDSCWTTVSFDEDPGFSEVVRLLYPISSSLVIFLIRLGTLVDEIRAPLKTPALEAAMTYAKSQFCLKLTCERSTLSSFDSETENKKKNRHTHFHKKKILCCSSITN